MNAHGIGTQGYAGRSAISPGAGPAADGLRAFDELSRAVAARRDAVVRDVRSRAESYPLPGHVSPAAAAGTLIGSAVAAFAGSDAGRAAIEHAISAAASALKGILGAAGTAAQLPLPFE